MATSRNERVRVDEPSSAARFVVRIGDVEVGVARVSAPTLASDLASATVRPGTRQTGHVVWSAKPVRNTVVFARAIDGDRTFYQWRRAALSEDPRAHDTATRDVEVSVLDAAGRAPVVTYRLVGAWPLRWSGPALDALVPSVAYEELEVVYHDLVLR